MRRIFFDDNLEKEISVKGFVVIDKLLDSSACDKLISDFKIHKVNDDRAFTISNWNNDIEYRSNTFQAIKEVVLPRIIPFLDAFYPVMGVYTVKSSGKKSDMLLHQDWSLVDESKYRSVSVWVALCDMDSHNGNLQLGERSHLYCGYPRGMNIPVPFEHIRFDYYKYLTDVPLKKGDAIIFDHRVIHASPENLSTDLRLAAVLALIPEEAELIHYYKYPDDNSHLEVLLMDRDKFHLIDFFDMPQKPKHLSVIKLQEASFPELKVEDIPTA